MSDQRGTKYMEMLQATITRMAGYSFVAKGWSVTIAAAILGLAVKDGGALFLWVGALTVTLFWLIDAYYLSLERGFRDLFKAAAADYGAGNAETFDMAVPVGVERVLATAFRPAVLMIHPPLLLAFLLAGIILCHIARTG